MRRIIFEIPAKPIVHPEHLLTLILVLDILLGDQLVFVQHAALLQLADELVDRGCPLLYESVLGFIVDVIRLVLLTHGRNLLNYWCLFVLTSGSTYVQVRISVQGLPVYLLNWRLYFQARYFSFRKGAQVSIEGQDLKHLLGGIDAQIDLMLSCPGFVELQQRLEVEGRHLVLVVGLLVVDVQLVIFVNELNRILNAQALQLNLDTTIGLQTVPYIQHVLDRQSN